MILLIFHVPCIVKSECLVKIDKKKWISFIEYRTSVGNSPKIPLASVLVRIFNKRFYMTNNQKFIAGLLLGAVAGAALALFMKTEKGQEILSDVQEGADKVQDELKEKLHEFDTAVNDLLSKGKAFINDLEQKAQQTGNGTAA